MSLWEHSEVLSRDKLNLKTAYIASTPPSNPVNGMLWVDTSNPNLFLIKVYRNGSWDIAKGALTDRVIAPTPAGSDYLTPSSASASSETPHITGSSSIGQGVNHLSSHRSQKCSFYASGRHWIFYSPSLGAGSIYYTSSTDLSNWSTPVALDKQTSTEYGWDTWFDGTYLHIVLREAGTYNIYYRRATPNSDGTLTWSADWQWITSITLTTTHRVCCDENRYVFVLMSTSESIFACKSGNNDGTWGSGTSWSFENVGGYGAVGSYLTGGKMLAAYVISSTKNVYFRVFNGSSWSAATQVGTASTDYSFTTPYRDPYDGSLHFTYSESSSVKDVKVTPSGSWSTSTLPTSLGCLGSDERGILYFWHDSVSIRVRRLLDGAWGSDILVVSTGPQRVYSGSPSQTYVYAYTTGSGAPYAVNAAVFKQQYPAADAKDDFSSSGWQPNPPNQQDAWIRFDLAGSNIGGVAGCRILFGADANYRPQAYKVQSSVDASTWEDVATQSTQPPQGWVEHSWLAKPNTRYIRILITQHGPSGTRLYEFDYYQSSIWRHGHRGD